MIQFIAPICISSVGVWLIMFLNEPTLFESIAVRDFILAVVSTIFFYLPIYVVSDLLRRVWSLPPWSIPFFAAGVCFFIGYLICFGLSHDPVLHSASGFLYYGGAVIFLPSLCFGIPYTFALYVRRPRKV
jgi:hypothetical protein